MIVKNENVLFTEYDYHHQLQTKYEIVFQWQT